jgi:hypothetical protein
MLGWIAAMEMMQGPSPKVNISIVGYNKDTFPYAQEA